MGLDMYLKAKKYISNFDFSNRNDREVNAKVKEAIGLTGFDSEDNSVEVTVNIGYWRKANQVHAWFVENCQDGVDECQESYVSREQLTELRDLCNEVLNTKNHKLLEPRSGFFFGSTDIDDWYWSDLRDTVEMLTKILDNKQLQDYDFYYRSSW